MFDRHYQTHAAAVLRYLRRLLRDQAAADDVAQMTWLRAWQGRESYDSGRPYAAWLYAIATRSAIDWLRTERRHRMASLDAGEGFDIADTGTDDVARLAEAIDALPDYLRDEVTASLTDGQTIEERSISTGRPAGTIKSRLHVARRLLRAAMEDAA